MLLFTAFSAKKSFFVKQAWSNTFGAWDIELPVTSTLQVIISVCYNINLPSVKNKDSLPLYGSFLFVSVCPFCLNVLSAP